MTIEYVELKGSGQLLCSVVRDTLRFSHCSGGPICELVGVR